MREKEKDRKRKSERGREREKEGMKEVHIVTTKTSYKKE